MLQNRKMPVIDGKIYRIARKLAELHFNRKKWYGACTKEERTEWLVNEYWDGWIKDAEIMIEEFNMITPEKLAEPGSEHAIQTALFQWAALETKNYPQLKWLYAVPNGFFASSGQKGKMKAEGLREGVPDIVLPCPKYGIMPYAGLYIEMKREIYRNRANGGCSEDQLKWLAYLNEAGYKAVVCYGWMEAKQAIEEYLNA